MAVVYSAAQQLPITITSSSPLPSGAAGTPYAFQFSASNAQGTVFWSIFSGSVPNLSLSATGLLSGTPQTPGIYTFRVIATDLADNSDQRTFTLAIAGSPLTITTTSLPAGQVNQDYFATLNAIGGGGTYAWSVNGGALPPGLALSVSGAISGRPATTGIFSFSVLVRDLLNGSATRNLSISVGVAPPPVNPPAPPDATFQITSTCSVTPFALNQSVDIPISTNTPGFYQYQVVSPSWIKIQVTNGVTRATGTPPGPGRYSLSVVVKDYIGASQTLNCNFDVAPALVLVPVPDNTGSGGLACPAQTIVEGSALVLPLQVNGGYPPYSWTLSGPSWLTLQSTSGTVNRLSGTALVGTASYTITIQDAIRSTPLTVQCTFSVVPNAPTILTAGCPAQKLLALNDFTVPLSVSGGAGGYQWTLVTGPPGFQLSANSGPAVSITGSLPREGGTYSITVRATDQKGVTAEFKCTIEVVPALSVEGRPPQYVPGQSFSTTLVATGGQPPYTWTLNGPATFTLSTSGPTAILSGTPPSTDPISCAVTLTDGIGSRPFPFDCSGTPRFVALEVRGTCPTAPVLLEAPFSITLTAAGGNGDYRWSAPVRPSWLSAPPASGSTITLTGSPTTVADAPLTIALTDTAGNAAAQFSCTLQVNPPPIPAISIVGLNLSGGLGVPITAALQLGNPSPATLAGVAEVTFVSNATNLVRIGGVDDRTNPEVTFRDPLATNNATRLPFTIAKGAVTVPLGQIAPGTVAGKITVRVISLTAAGRDVLGTNSPFNDVDIPRLAPVLDEVTLENSSASGFTVVVKGYSTPRDGDTLNLTFTPRGDVRLRNTSVDVAVTTAFRDYFTSTQSRLGGGTFSIRVPVTITGNANDIAGVTVRLSTAIGQSNSRTVNR